MQKEIQSAEDISKSMILYWLVTKLLNILNIFYEFSHDEVMIDFYVKDSCHTNIQ